MMEGDAIVPHASSWGVEKRDVTIGHDVQFAPRLASAGVMINARSVAAWDGTPFDVAWAMDVLRPRSGGSGRS